MIIKKILKRIKKYLVKKVEIVTQYSAGNNLVFEFQLTNFFFSKKPIEAELIIGDDSYKLDHELKKNNLSLFIPHTLLSTIVSTSQIKLTINHKTIWITEKEEYKNGDYNESLLIGNKYLVTRVKKKIFISSRFSELFFTSESIPASVISQEYNTLKASLDLNGSIAEGIEVYVFNNRHFRILECAYDGENNELAISDFSEMAAGLWRMFVQIDNKLYPLSLEKEVDGQFSSYNHVVEVLERNSSFYLNLEPHSLAIDSISLEEDGETGIALTVSLPKDTGSTEYALLLDEPKSGTSKAYLFAKNGRTLTAVLPIEDLSEKLFAKRFFVIEQNEHSIMSKFQLSKAILADTNLIFRPVTNSQITKLKFYLRKDKSLGLKVSLPKLRKTVIGINDFVLEGKMSSTEEFIDASPFLILEDRLTLEYVKIPISEYFTIDLKEIDLVSIKGKDKTVLDLFVIIENHDGEVVRKEKIKYKFANYKKDNFYSSHTVKHINGDIHYFMITTTPFNNLKVESFTIPHTIDLPANPEMKDENIWLLGERSNTAQDNGIVLFHWLQENTDIDAFYVIEEESLDYEHIKDNPNVLVFGSPLHFEIAFKAKVLLCTHDLENILPYKPAEGFFGYENTTKIFLQHGVLGRKNVEYHKQNYELPFDLFIVSSDPEKQVIVMDEMGYDDHEVAVTGLARFDNLVQRKKPKDILLMPTWRDWISTDEQFLKSEYYYSYSNLIQNEKLLELLEEYDVNLHFYPHYRAQNYFQSEVDDLHERIKFISLGSQTVQKLLIDHALLVTDYSSVSFDFTLLNKPVIYYHFDVNRFFLRGILRPVDETFIGGVATYEDELIALIEDRIRQGFANFDYDISGIIKYQDQSNCERIYRHVLSLTEQPAEAV